MNKIKIMRVIARLNIGGPAIHTILLTEGLDKSHFESILVSGVADKNEKDMQYLADKKGIKPIIIKELGRDINFKNDLIAFFKLFKLIKKEKPFIIHTHTAKAGMLGRFAAIVCRVPIKVHTFHGHIFHGYFGFVKTRLFILIEQILALFTDKIIAVSPKQKEDLSRQFKIAGKDKIEVIRLGFELEEFLSLPEENTAFKNRLNLENDCLVIGIIGRLTPVKNHRMFIETANQLLKNKKLENKKLKFIIVGDGELRQELQSLVTNKRLDEMIKFIGWQTEMSKIYAALDIVTLTSVNEGTPVTLIEAMASAKATISTNVGGVSDLITHNLTGLLVGSNDIPAFENAILCLIEHPDERRRLGCSARQFIKENYSKDKLLRDMDNLYRGLVQEKDPAICFN
jgi:glycosyltransferase involved in cell wall biosynthesis